ncbi:MAG TPA: disulfide bond formation protein B [Gammaproteobacteria bacterium]|nr:disulfide bond formation protein B [Gammaproteobacteria bacterium]
MSLQRLSYLLIFLVCAGLLGFGYYLEYGKGLDPCPLCILQRLFFLVIGLGGLIAALHNPKSLGIRIYSGFLVLLSVMGATVAGRQAWLQHLPPDQAPECGPGLEYMLEIYPLGETLVKILKGTGDCAEVDWTFLGLSIAEWALISFIVLTAVSVLQLWKAGSK